MQQQASSNCTASAASVQGQGRGKGDQAQVSGGDGSAAGCDRDEVWLSEEEAALVQRFDPAAPTDTIGFYVAAFEKTGAVGVS